MSEILLDLATKSELGRVRIDGDEYPIVPITTAQRAQLLQLAANAKGLAGRENDEAAAAEALQVGNALLRMAMPSLPQEVADKLPLPAWTRLVEVVRDAIMRDIATVEEAAAAHPLSDQP